MWLQLSGKSPTINSRLRRLLRQTRLTYLTALLVGITFVFSGMLANEHNFKVVFYPQCRINEYITSKHRSSTWHMFKEKVWYLIKRLGGVVAAAELFSAETVRIPTRKRKWNCNFLIELFPFWIWLLTDLFFSFHRRMNLVTRLWDIVAEVVPKACQEESFRRLVTYRLAHWGQENRLR